MVGHNKMTEGQRPRILEVIVTSVDDALAAEQGGAGRLEVIRNLAVGGLTPPLELVKEIQSEVSIPLRVMLRENAGFAISSQQEYEKLCSDASALAGLGIEGLVLGFLQAGDIDFEALRGILNQAANLKATFHRAFEVLADPFHAIRLLKSINQIDRILTSGGRDDWQQNIELLTRLQAETEPEITLLVGGGLTMAKLARLCAETGLREYHLGRAVRQGQQIDGVVAAAQVKTAMQIIG